MSGGTLTTAGSGEIITSANQNANLVNTTIGTGSNYLAENNSTTFVTGKLTNDGTFTFEAGNNNTIINLNSLPVEFAGTGTFVLNNQNAFINGNGTLSIDSGITIMGAGQLTSIAVTNQGLILANSTVGALSISPIGSGLTNTGGIIRATNGATANLNSGGYTNTGGTITADTGSAVRLNNGSTVVGGLLTTTGTGEIITTGGLETNLVNVTIGAGSNYLVENNGETFVTGKLTNNGTFTFAAGGNNTLINLNSLPVEFAGTGSFVLNNPNAYINGSGTLSIDSGITIMGSGQLSNINVLNQGLIVANSTLGALTISPSGGGVTNTGGIIRATNGATASLNGGSYINTGGTITADTGSAIRFNNGASVTGGILSSVGTGTIFSTAGDNVSLTDVTLTAGSNYVAENNTTTTVGGTLTNDGTFTFAAAGNITNTSLNSLPVEFAGTGAFILNNPNAVINGGGTLTIDPAITIEGSGQLTNIAINNQGLILANSTIGSMAISTNGGGLNNTGGRIEASAGNTLNMNGATTNTGGTLTADTASAISFGNGASVIGGLLTTTGTGQLISSAGVNVTLNNVTLSTGSNYYAQNNSTTFIVGNFTNNGTYTFQALGNTTNINLNNGSVQFAGTGTFILNNPNAVIDGGGTLTIDPGITIEGSGSLSGIAINNQGLIIANSTAGSMVITPNGAGLNNAGGRVEASAGNTINMGGTTTNTGGTLTADANSAINFGNGATIIGGLLITTGNGTISTVAGITVALNNVTITTGSNYYVGNNSTTFITGGKLTNDGTFTFQAGGNSTNINLNNTTVEFAGTGTIVLNNVNAGINGGGTLTIDPTITIEGGGFMTGIAIDNQGLILGNNSTNALTINVNANGMVNAGGVLRATDGSTISLNGGPYNNTGGTLTADTGSAIRLNNSVSVTGGILSSNGTGEIAVASGITVGLANVTITAGSLVNVENNAQANLSGVITNDGNFTISSSVNVTEARIFGNTEFAGTGTFTLGNSTQNYLIANAGETLTVDAGVTIQGAGNLGNTQTGLVNAGTFIANDPTNLIVSPNTTGFSNTGTLIATNGATMTVNGLQQDTAGILTAGTYIADENSHLNLNSPNVTTIGAAATVILNGTASSMPVIDNPINTTGFVTENDGHFELLGDRSYTVTSLFTNDGTLVLGGGTFTAASLTNNTSGDITGFGTIAERPLNHGTIEASGGTLTLVNGILGGSGTIESDPGSVLNLSGGTAGSNGDLLIIDGSLTIGGNNVLVAQNYTNANFGSGNAFNKHANISATTGQIIADGNNTQTITGNVTGSSQANLSLAFGNIHVGDTKSFMYQVNNIGTSGPSVLFALQTAANGGNVTDSRLTGSGVTAANIGLVPLGGSTSPLAVNFSGVSAGSLTGQSIHIANNFDGSASASLVEQTVTISGAAYRYAAPLLSGNPINFGNVHVGDPAPIGDYLLSNTDPADGFSESLDASLSGAAGPVVISGGVNLLTAGDTSSTGISATLASTATAGHYTGSAVLTLISDGTNTSGLGLTDLSAVTLQSSVSVYRFANGVLTNNPVNFHNVHVNDTVSQLIAITNAVPTDGFSESLDGSLTLVNAPGSFTGNFGQLVAGGTANITASLNTAAAGSISDTATLVLFSDGANSSGLGITPRSTVTLSSTGGVYRLAAPQVSTTSVTFPNAHMGDAISTLINISNTDPADSFSESLDGTLSGVTNNEFTGNFLLLPAGQTTSITATFNTLNAGHITETANLGLTSDGAETSGLPATQFNSVSLSSSGNVYRLASPGTLPSTINLGTIHVNNSAAATTTLTIANTQVADGFSEQLGASFNGTTGNVAASGGPILVNASTSDTTHMQITLDTSTAELGRSGTATVHLISSGNIDGLSDTFLSDKTVTLTADVLNFAVAALQKNSGSGNFTFSGTSATLDFGSINSGDSISAVLAALNNVLAPADTLGGTWSIVTQDAAFTLSGFSSPLGAITAGQAGSSLGVSFSSVIAGEHTEQLVLDPTSSDNAPFTGPLPDVTLTIDVNVNPSSVPEPASLVLFLAAAPALLRRRRRQA